MTTLHQWLAAEPFALALSSGFFGFFAHTGVVTALHERGLRPTAIHGSSAGALVGGLWAAGLEPEAMTAALVDLRRADFWDPAPGFGLLRGAAFRRMLEALLPVTHIEDCPVPVRLSAFDVVGRRTVVLDRGPLAPAIAASCAFPGLFQPCFIDGRPYLDGGILDRPGLAAADPAARTLYHHLASRSPWRRRASPALTLPDEPRWMSLVVEGLPRSGPTRLDRGRRALELARAAARRALDRPATSPVRVQA